MNTPNNKRFRVLTAKQAQEAGVDVSVYYDDERRHLVEFIDEQPPRYVACDGGEPEDQTFGRDWSWVPVELNKLAEQLDVLRRAAERVSYTQGYSDGRAEHALDQLRAVLRGERS